jgi:hypothetical protein
MKYTLFWVVVGMILFGSTQGFGQIVLSPPTRYDLSVSGCQSLAVADFNLDGWPDLAVGALSGVTVMLNRGTGTSQSRRRIPSTYAMSWSSLSRNRRAYFNAPSMRAFTGSGAGEGVRAVFSNSSSRASFRKPTNMPW